MESYVQKCLKDHVLLCKDSSTCGGYKKAIDASEKIWHCDACSWDKCMTCAKDLSAERRCPNGHDLAFIDTHPSIVCGACGQKIASIDSACYCTHCSWYKCLKCADKSKKYVNEAGKCPNAHMLKYYEQFTGTACDVCGKVLGTKDDTWYCVLCMWDRCEQCM